MWLWIVLALSLGVKGDLDQWCKTQGKVVKCDRLKETNWSERRDCCCCPREWPFWRSPQSVYRGCRRSRCGEPICSTVPALRDFPLWLSIAVSVMHRQVDIKKYIGYIHVYIFLYIFFLNISYCIVDHNPDIRKKALNKSLCGDGLYNGCIDDAFLRFGHFGIGGGGGWLI